MPAEPRPIHLRSADRLHPGDVVVLDDQPPAEVRRVHELGAGHHLVVTAQPNLHFVRHGALVQVVAEYVGGIGFVTPLHPVFGGDQ